MYSTTCINLKDAHATRFEINGDLLCISAFILSAKKNDGARIAIDIRATYDQLKQLQSALNAELMPRLPQPTVDDEAMETAAQLNEARKMVMADEAGKDVLLGNVLGGIMICPECHSGLLSWDLHCRKCMI